MLEEDLEPSCSPMRLPILSSLAFPTKKALVLSCGGTLLTLALVSGAMCNYLLSRFWLSKSLKSRCLANNRVFRAVNHEITRTGWRTVLLLRLAPFPYAITSYLLGMTNLRMSCFIKGTFAIALKVALWLWIGTSITSLT